MAKKHQSSLYTLILDWNGGTYVSQIEASDAPSALLAWADEFRLPQTKPHKRISLGPLNVHENLVPASDCRNVWCASGRIGSKLALVHLVLTRE